MKKGQNKQNSRCKNDVILGSKKSTHKNDGKRRMISMFYRRMSCGNSDKESRHHDVKS